MTLLTGRHLCQTSFFVCPVIYGLLIAILEGVPEIQALTCFHCDAVHFNFECNRTDNIRQCPITYDTCQTMVRYSSEVGKLQISKRCSKSASCEIQRKALTFHAPCDANQSTEWACAECCGTDLCNMNAGSTEGPVTSSHGLAEFVAFVVSISLWQIFG